YCCFQAEDGIRDWSVTGVQTCALPIFSRTHEGTRWADARLDFSRVRTEPPPACPCPRPRARWWVQAEAKPAKRIAWPKATIATRSEERRVGKESRSR